MEAYLRLVQPKLLHTIPTCLPGLFCDEPAPLSAIAGTTGGNDRVYGELKDTPDVEASDASLYHRPNELKG
ncbi:hypothetical protein [Agrobacterium radiobacter]|uniref:hypothetical protein n=1 Tax=Agrobacterium radiobacter TaxID=362 RepID=UPI003CEEC7E3